MPGKRTSYYSLLAVIWFLKFVSENNVIFSSVIFSCIKVGQISQQSEGELVENVIHAMKVIGRKVPGSWKNIRCFHIKSSSSIALPVYQSSPLTNVRIDEIPDVPEQKPKKRKRNVKIVGDDAKENNDVSNDGKKNSGASDDVPENEDTCESDKKLTEIRSEERKGGDRKRNRKSGIKNENTDEVSAKALKKSVTPAKKAVTSAKKSVTPAQKSVTPAKKAMTPAKKSATSAKKSAKKAKKN